MLKHRNFIQFHHYKYKPPHKSQTYPICGAMKSQVNENQGFPQKKPPQGEARTAAEADEAQKVAQVWVKPSNQGISSNIKHITGWWFQTCFIHFLFFHHIWDVILPIDFHIFQRG